MPRKRKVYSTHFPYHMTGRTNNGHPFPCEMQEAWNIYCNALLFYSKIFNTRILAFVMMSNHFHLIMSTPNGNLSDFMKLFMKRTSDDIRSIRGLKNHLYGDRYYPSLITNQVYFQTVLKYVYQNPVRAGIARDVLDYSFTSLNGFLGFKKLEIPIYDDFGFFDDLNGNLNWLSERYESEIAEQIKKGLHFQEFKPDRDKSGYADDTLLKKTKGTSILTHCYA